MKIIALILIACVYGALCANTQKIQYCLKDFDFKTPFNGYFIEEQVFTMEFLKPAEDMTFILKELETYKEVQNNLQFWNNVWFYSFIGTGALLVASIIYIIVTALIPRPVLGVRF
jgi:hypothetical protein